MPNQTEQQLNDLADVLEACNDRTECGYWDRLEQAKERCNGMVEMGR